MIGARRVGVVCPPDNHIADTEPIEALFGHASVHVTRFAPERGHHLRERLALYNTQVDDQCDRLVGLQPEAILFGCTGTAYLRSPEEDDADFARLTEKFGYPIKGTCRCIRDRLAELGAQSIELITPYESWLTELSAAHWEAAGIRVVGIHPIGGGMHPYAVDEEAVRVEALKHLSGPGDAVLVTGTGVGSIHALAEIAPLASRPITSSMVCAIDWLRSVVDSEPARSSSLYIDPAQNP